MWAVMEHFGYKELPEELNGAKVHRLENVMTVVPGFHMRFDTEAVSKAKIWTRLSDHTILGNYIITSL
jgi:hypothetical protein